MFVLAILIEDTAPSSSAENIIQEKNLTFDKFDEKILLSKLKNNQNKKALEILRHIKDQPDQLTFDDKGTVFIEQTSLPNSNIYKLLQALLTSKSNEPGFSSFVLKLQQMGLSRFIPKKSQPPLDNSSSVPIPPYNLDQWYYLGP